MVRRLDNLLPYLMLMIKYLWGFYWGVCFQELQKIQINREVITGSVVSPGARMFLNDSVILQNLNPLVVWRECDLVTMTDELQQDATAFWRQTIKVTNSRLINRAPPLESAPPIDKPADNNERRNAFQQPRYDVVPHGAKTPNARTERQPPRRDNARDSRQPERTAEARDTRTAKRGGCSLQ